MTFAKESYKQLIYYFVLPNDYLRNLSFEFLIFLRHCVGSFFFVFEPEPWSAW